MTLLERTSRRVDLTRAGEAFLGEARRTLDAAGSARRAARQPERPDGCASALWIRRPTAYDLLSRPLAAATNSLAIAVPAERTVPLAMVLRDLSCDHAPSIDALLTPLRGTDEA